jgi:hypothetical protein
VKPNDNGVSKILVQYILRVECHLVWCKWDIDVFIALLVSQLHTAGSKLARRRSRNTTLIIIGDI